MKALWNKIKNWMNTNNHLLWVSIIALVVLGLLGMYFIGPYYAARIGFGPNIFFNKVYYSMFIPLIRSTKSSSPPFHLPKNWLTITGRNNIKNSF